MGIEFIRLAMEDILSVMESEGSTLKTTTKSKGSDEVLLIKRRKKLIKPIHLTYILKINLGLNADSVLIISLQTVIYLIQ